jgi:hypothetical protein
MLCVREDKVLRCIVLSVLEKLDAAVSENKGLCCIVQSFDLGVCT